MKFIYYIEGFLAFSDPDTYDKGCDPFRSKSHFDPAFRCEAATLEGLISELCQEFHCGRDCILLDSCDEEGRLDLQVYQSSPFSVHKVSNKVNSEWLAGKRKELWLTNYIFEVKFRIEGMPLHTYPDFLNKLPKS